MRRFLLLISIIVHASAMTAQVNAQSLFPTGDGEKTKLDAMIEMPRGYISGICILMHDGSKVKGSLFNEFGISALDFVYDTSKDKVKITNVISFIDKWYIKRVLRKDLREVMHCLEKRQSEYKNHKRNIVYRFLALTNDTER